MSRIGRTLTQTEKDYMDIFLLSHSTLKILPRKPNENKKAMKKKSLKP
jgi:hypothetical protein